MSTVCALVAFVLFAVVGTLSPLTGAEPMSPDAAYITALEKYQLAELAVQQGHIEDAKKYLKESLAARDIAVAAYRLRANEPDVQRRLGELLSLDRPCCGKPSISTTISIDPK